MAVKPPNRSTLVIAGLSAAGAVAGGLLVWRLRKRRSQPVELLGDPRDADQPARAQGGEFCAKTEQQQADHLTELLQPVLSQNKLATKVVSLLREYRRGLADTVWLACREGKLQVVSYSLAAAVAAVMARGSSLDAARHDRAGGGMAELDRLARELDLVLQGGRRGAGSGVQKLIGESNNVSQSSSGSAGTASGTNGGSITRGPSSGKPTSGSKSTCGNDSKKASGCSGCSNGGCGGRSAALDVKELLQTCTTPEDRLALRDRLVDYEVNSLMTRNPNLVRIPDSRKAEIRKQVEATMDAAAEEIHRDMCAPGGGRNSNLAGALLVSEDGSVTVSTTNDFSD